MINHRLLVFLEENGVLNKNQRAFRRRRGTTTYFSDLREILAEVEQSNSHAEFALLDIEKAYDQAWRPHIMEQIDRLAIGIRMRNYIKNFLTDRHFRVTYGEVLSSERIQENGVPQGSVLPVTLFLLAINPVFEAIPKRYSYLSLCG